MKPAVSARNFTPSSTACESFAAATAGVVVLLHRLHGHVGVLVGVTVRVLVGVTVAVAVAVFVAVAGGVLVGVSVRVLVGVLVAGAVAVAGAAVGVGGAVKEKIASTQ